MTLQTSRVEFLYSSCYGEIKTTGSNNLHGAEPGLCPSQLQEQDHGASRKTRYAPNSTKLSMYGPY